MNQPSRLATLYLLGFALDLVNIFIASVAYPDIGRSLGASVATLAWIGNAYLLGLTLVIPLSVWLASRLGERRLMLLALAGFASASLGCGLAGSAATLIVWRLCQGLAGGLLIPLGQAMAYRNVPASARAGLTARVMLVALIVPAVAPALGGWLVDSLSWRGIFFASVAPALLVLVLAMRWLPRHKHAAQRLDLRGLLLGSAALATLLVALAWLGSPGGGGRGLLLALLACVLGCCYWRDGRARTDALLDLGLLEAPLLRTAMLVYLCVPGAFMGASLVAMLYLQGPLGLSASRAGALMLPWALAAGLAIGLTRRRFNRWGPKPLLLAGMAIQAGGLLWLARSGEGSGFWQLAGAYATMGFGGSLCSSAAQGMALLDVPAARMGHASALWNINRQLAFCLGMAVLGGLLNLLQARADPAAFVHCFLFAAAFTLLPLPWVRRIDSAGVRALVQT
ncbi:MDR family MFS transporter [Pseudomonas aeruginosa]|uniref:MDR family MFS transporter n=1 Tax=Pseudomonas aeruginosa TaxID=287 RepID=UPI002E29300F|nr:MDR family MFS transporter [Pseudomonas aeruginosa]